MKLPNNWMLFKTLVLEKIRTYCALKIWPYDYDLFTAWLSNFATPEDEYVALHLLDSLIVRSKEMAVSGYSRLLHGDLREYLVKNNIIDSKLSIRDWMSALKSGTLRNEIIFIPVRLKQDYGKSGSTLFRLLSKYVRTDITSEEISAIPFGKTIILIDDFIGGGTQFESYADEVGLRNVMLNSTVIYCPLIAIEMGMNRLKNIFPGLRILPVETIDISHSLFFTDNRNEKFRNDCDNSVEDIKSHYVAMKAYYAAKNMSFWLGKDEACLPLVFEWGCPNQTLSILWMDYSPKIENWRPLFSRRS